MVLVFFLVGVAAVFNAAILPMWQPTYTRLTGSGDMFPVELGVYLGAIFVGLVI